ncbi:selenocysteine-specific translation elongation factor [Geobacter sp. FeAm09]|uniref:selenocysteine-specific translation elongation factor n=1 Tax=Geobacter sp. FeAm09 TaxID=2597769 RepID=UPI002729AB2A|nr:selenocysteine-specific translation elongation factor [Geobacter sp. FeAm09]
MKHLILGTAGHIDHGKTSLVRTLTGIDTDRLKEEKARGITIELGFAHLELPGEIRFGIVDVPGHEKFVRAMVAGVGGMDMVMLVIAADEGIMPQTREHMDILRLLGVKSGLVALTKSDMVDREWLELVTEEVREFVAGSFLENAPVVPVSARTGAGLESLKGELALLADIASGKRREGHFRLPVDRVFTVAGFGTVVTGTLLSGEIAVGNELAVLPTGREGRVRSIQAHGCTVDNGLAGQRLAVNLQGVDLDEVHRGDVVTPRGVFRTTRIVDARLDYLAAASRELKHRACVRLHSATYEVQAQVILLDRNTLQPGESAYVQLRLNEPVLLVSGDSYILRTASPAATVGGGVVLDPFPPRRRRRNGEAVQLLSSLDNREHQRIISLLVGQSLLSGIAFEDVLLRAGIPRKAAEAALAALLSAGDIVQMSREPRILLGRGAFATLKKVLLDAVTTYVTANPLKSGIGKEELKTRLPQRSDQRFYTPLLLALEHEGKLLPDRDIVKPAGQISRPASSAVNRGEAITSFLQEKGIEAPTVKEIMERFRCDEKCVRDTMAMLTRNGAAVRVSDNLFYSGEVLSGLRDKLVSLLKDNGEITPPNTALLPVCHANI